MRFALLFLGMLLFSGAFAQITPTPGTQRRQAGAQREALRIQSEAAGIAFTNIGPSVFGGRVVDIAVDPKDPTHFYVAYASSGLWETKSNGTHFEPLFDHEAVMTIGDIAVDWERGHLWVGTGENNSSRSSYAGAGIYFSADNGKTWEHRGLEDSHHIGRIVLAPTSTEGNAIIVGALGPLYSTGGQRGIYRSTDNGKTWNNTLSGNENTGVIDVIVDPNDPNTIYAATWERHREAWNFQESGTGSAIYKSTDGGQNWTIVSGVTSNFPASPYEEGAGTGRIGLSASTASDGTTVLFATLDNQNRRLEKENEETDKLNKDFFKTATVADILQLEDKKLNSFLKDNDFPKGTTAESVKAQLKKKKITPLDVVTYLEDANRLLFDTEVVGAELYRSDDGGNTWQKTHDGYLDDLYYSYGYYFAQVRVHPKNPNEVYIMGVPVLRSDDGGKTFTQINPKNVHVDHHALWLNPDRTGHLILGNDGGINISYDAGETYFKCNTPAVGQFYSVAVDNSEPYRVFGGLQDNGVWVGPSTYEPSVEWHAEGQYPYRRIMGGDGMQVQIDPRNNDLVYTGYQFGNYYRLDLKKEKRTYITPKHELGERPYRWNWQAPILISRHQPDILYFGSNFLHRSFDRGDTWDKISADLTAGGKKGDVPFGTLTTIDESPLRFGLLYTGSDDGRIHVTKDGGVNWTRIDKNLPQGLWVTRVVASAHQEGRVYVSLNGYRNDHFEAYIYVSENYGGDWRRLGTNLPKEPVNVIKEDTKNPQLLFVGTDHGLYYSRDGGNTFFVLGDLPAVAVHDLVVQEREKDLVIGTHGRSFYKGNIAHLRQLGDSITDKQIHLFALDSLTHNKDWGKQWSRWFENEGPELSIPVYSKSIADVELEIHDAEGTTVYRRAVTLSRGLQSLTYDLTVNINPNEEAKADNGKVYVQPGTYEVHLGKSKSSFKVVKK